MDAAGIVFYPRYFEMLSETFPGLAPRGAPFELEIEFMSPTPLGTRLALELDGSADDGWRVSATAGGEPRFSLLWTSRPARTVVLAEHEPGRRAFRADAMRVRDWSAGPDGGLQLSRYYEYVNAAVEQWFENELALPFSALHADRSGIPTVSLKSRFAVLPRFGEEFRIWIRPVRVGISSLHFDSMLVNAAGCLAKTSQVIVFARREGGELRSVPFPESLRTAILSQLAGADGE